MPFIFEAEVVAKKFKQGIKHLAGEANQTITAYKHDLGAEFGVTGDTVDSWRYASSIPSKFDDHAFWGIVWYLLKTNHYRFKWFEELFLATNIPVTKPINVNLFRAYLDNIRLSGEPLPLSEMDNVIALYFGHDDVIMSYRQKEMYELFANQPPVSPTFFRQLVPLDPLTKKYIVESNEILWIEQKEVK